MTNKDEDKKIRARIKYWLEVHDVSRRELADKLQVTESALNGWLSNKALPPARWEEIKTIFEQYEEPERKRIVGTSLSEKEFSDMKMLAERRGLTIDAFFRECLLKQAQLDLSEQ